MIIFIRVLLGVYLLAMNAYAFFQVKLQRDDLENDRHDCAVSDGRLLIAALLGGGVGVYTALFAFRHRLRSMLLMVAVPVIIVLNAYLAYLAFTAQFPVVRPIAAPIAFILS